MSAWLCSNVHISALVQQMWLDEIIGHDEADEVWRVLRWENLHSLHARYGDELPAMADVEIHRTVAEAELDPVAILKATHCYDYQACETNDYDASRAAGYVAELRAVLRDRLGVPSDALSRSHLPTYDAAPWGITSWSDVILKGDTPTC